MRAHDRLREAIDRAANDEPWIASSQALLAMTASKYGFMKFAFWRTRFRAYHAGERAKFS